MPRKTVAAIQHFRGTTAQHNTYTGPAGELTVDTTKKTVVVQDGATKGGNPVALEKRKIVSSASFLKVNSAASGTLAKDNTLNWDMDGFLDSLATYVGVLPDFAMPGVVVAFSGQFGGEGNRYPIPEDTGVPDTNWVLCDGVETDGIAVPDLRDKFIIGAGPDHTAGTTGGSFTTDNHTLVNTEMPTHAHAGAMNITGDVQTNGYGNSGTKLYFVFGNTSTSGESQPHSHTYKPPYYSLAFIKQIHRRQSMVVMPPVNFERESLFTSHKYYIIVPQYTQVRIGSKVYVNMQPVRLDIRPTVGIDKRRGKDIYLYACVPAVGLEPVFVCSLNSTVPEGYTAENSRKIGGFHCLCADAGTIVGHDLSGYVDGDILPRSVWDLRHRAFSENEGMVWVPETHLWWDIYLASRKGTMLGLQSVYNGVIINGESDPSINGEDFVELMASIRKRLPFRHEFQVAAYNSNLGTSIQGGDNPNTTGGHVDTAGRRMISNYGLEDCCGVMWQWTNDLFEGGAYGTVSSGQAWLTGYGWNMGVNSVGGQGSATGVLRRATVGGGWEYAQWSGRRTVRSGHASACVDTNFGGRGVSEPRIWEG